MNWFKKLMAGRYGSDQLSMGLIILAVLLTLISGFSAKLKIFQYLSYIPLLFCLFRMFSRDINRRRTENYKFVMLLSPLYSWSLKKLGRLKDIKSHKYFRCPNCRSTLRLPRGKGKLSITCPKCRTEFTGRT